MKDTVVAVVPTAAAAAPGESPAAHNPSFSSSSPAPSSSNSSTSSSAPPSAMSASLLSSPPSSSIFLAANSKDPSNQAAVVAPFVSLAQRWWEAPQSAALVAVVWRSNGCHALLMQIGTDDGDAVVNGNNRSCGLSTAATGVAGGGAGVPWCSSTGTAGMPSGGAAVDAPTLMGQQQRRRPGCGRVFPAVAAACAVHADFHPEFDNILLVVTKAGVVLLYQLQAAVPSAPSGSVTAVTTSMAPHLALDLAACDYGGPTRVAWTTLNATSFFTFHEGGTVFVWNLVLLQTAVAKQNGCTSLQGTSALLSRCAKKFRLLNPSVPQPFPVEILMGSDTANAAKKLTFLVRCGNRFFITDALKHGAVLSEYEEPHALPNCQPVGLLVEGQRSFALLGHRQVTVLDVDWEHSQIGRRWRTEIELDDERKTATVCTLPLAAAGAPGGRRVTLLGQPQGWCAVVLSDEGPGTPLRCLQLAMAVNGRVNVYLHQLPFQHLRSHRCVTLLPGVNGSSATLLVVRDDDKTETIREFPLQPTAAAAVWMVHPRISGAVSTSASTPRLQPSQSAGSRRRTSGASLCFSDEDSGGNAMHKNHRAKSGEDGEPPDSCVGVSNMLSEHRESCAAAIKQLTKEMGTLTATVKRLTASVGQLQLQVASVLETQSLLASALVDQSALPAWNSAAPSASVDPAEPRGEVGAAAAATATPARPPDRSNLAKEFCNGLLQARYGRKGWDSPWIAALAHDCLEGTPATERRALRSLCAELRAPEAMGSDWLKLTSRQLLSSAGVLAACLLEHSDWEGEDEVEMMANWICELALAAQRFTVCDVPLGTRLVLVETLKACQGWARSQGFETSRRSLETARTVIEARTTQR